MNETTRILIVEDASIDIGFAMHEIRKTIPHCELQRVETQSTFMNAVEEFKPDLILSGYQMPHFSGMEALKLARDHTPQTPLIIYTDSLNEDVIVECIKAGAYDCVNRNNIRRLESAVTHALEEKKSAANTPHITGHKLAERSLRESEEKFRSIIEQSNDGIILIDEQGIIIEWNKAATHITSIPREKALGAPFWEIQYQMLTPKRRESLSLEEYKEVFTQMFQTKKREELEKTVEIEFVTINGEIKFLHQTSFIITTEKGIRIGAIVQDITERKLAEAALQKSEIRFASVFRVSPISMAITRLSDNCLLDVNEAWQVMTGFQKEEVLGHSILEFASWADPSERQKLLQQLKEHGQIQNFEFQLMHRSGEIRQLLMSADLIELAGEACMVSLALDITERKKTEEELHRSKERFHALVQNSADLIAVIDETGIIQYASPTSERILGYTTAESIGRNFIEWVHPEDIPLALESLISRSREAGTANQSIEVRGQHKDGTWRDIEVLGTNLLTDPVIKGIVLNMRDITGRKQSEKEIAQAEERFHKAFYSGPVGLAITRASNSVFIEANDAFSRIVGFSHQELIDHTSLALQITTQDQRDEYVELIKRDGCIRDKEMTLRHKTGEIRIVLGSMEIIELNHETCVLSTAIDITERKHAEKYLQESEEKYRALFQNAQIGMFRSLVEDSTILAVNPKFCEIFGYTEQELLSKPAFLLWAQREDRDQVVLELKEKGRLNDHEVEIRTKNGDVRTLLLSAQYLQDKSYMEGSVMDITSRKQAEDWVSRLNHQLEGILNSAGEGIYGVDIEGRITFINPAMARIIGWDTADLLGHRMHSICHHTRTNGQPYPENECPAFLAFHDGIACPSSIDFYWHKDGRMIPVENTITPIREGDKLAGAVVVVSDITNRLQLENETNQHVTEMEMLYESGLALSQLLSPREIGQKIIELLEKKMNWHHTAIRLYHAKTDSLELLAFSQPNIKNEKQHSDVEKHFNNKISKPGDGLSGWVVQNFQIIRNGDVSNDPRYKETYPGLNSGLYVPIKMGASIFGVISIESEKPDAFSEADERLVVTLANQAAVAFENARLFQTAQQEIIERSRVEQLLATERNQLAQHVEERTADLLHANMDLARALRVKDEFLASMSHELRTPLTGILGFSEALQLKAYGELSEKQVRPIKAIEDSGRHLLELINDILDLSKIEAEKLELQFAACSIADICQASLQIIKGMAHHKNQMVHYSPTDEPIAVFADSRRLKQVLVNLLSNAVKFTPEGGELGLDIEPLPVEQKIKLSVWDKGIGIKADDLPKLFKPFTQIDGSLAREYSGTGLGLSLAHRLVELHNGEIVAESIPGKGSRFIVTLPWLLQTQNMISHKAEINKPDSFEDPENSNSILIMIADDNETILSLIGDFLALKQYRVMKAHSGMELMQKVTEILPDLILMDIQMPGMDGLETIRRIRSHSIPAVASIPTIAITALAMPGDRERCLQAGANEYMSKPVELQKLVSTIQKLTEKQK